ncbi:MAG: hypothetical protein EAZ55_05980 [Cytophagales bacterium]|nr:MAG: hypothetical protein EAZ55_05980 [Cytophagales bacterium]
MNILAQRAIEQLKTQVVPILTQIKSEEYQWQNNLQSPIGKHIRHVIEFYQVLLLGIPTAVVNYDQRKREPAIEKDPLYALYTIENIITRLYEAVQIPTEWVLITQECGEDIRIATNFERELLYIIEHTVHHLAIIKHSLDQHFEHIILPEGFGVATSTLQNMKMSTK